MGFRRDIFQLTVFVRPHKLIPVEVEREQFLKSGRKVPSNTPPIPVIQVGEDEILALGDDGTEYSSYHERADDEADGGKHQTPSDFAHVVPNVLYVESLSKTVGASAKSAKAILWRSAISGRIIGRSAITGQIVSQGGIKSKGRKKNVFLSGSVDDEKSG